MIWSTVLQEGSRGDGPQAAGRGTALHGACWGLATSGGILGKADLQVLCISGFLPVTPNKWTPHFAKQSVEGQLVLLARESKQRPPERHAPVPASWQGGTPGTGGEQVGTRNHERRPQRASGWEKTLTCRVWATRD